MATFLLSLLVVALAVAGLAAGLLLAGRPLRRGCARDAAAGGDCVGCSKAKTEGDDR